MYCYSQTSISVKENNFQVAKVKDSSLLPGSLKEEEDCLLPESQILLPESTSIKEKNFQVAKFEILVKESSLLPLANLVKISGK